MALASLFNQPSDERSLMRWSFSNADGHTRIINAIAAQRGVNLTQYILDPIDARDLQGFLRRHQTMHNDMNGVLGLAGQDLSDVDFKNPKQLAAFIFIHAVEHRNANFALGI